MLCPHYANHSLGEYRRSQKRVLARLPAMIGTALAIFTTLPLAAATSDELETKFLSDARCRDEIFSTLRGKGAYRRNFTTTREWSQVLGRGTDGSVTLRSPTTVSGLWAQVKRFANAEVEIHFVTAKVTRTIRFDVHPTDRNLDNCKNATETRVTRKLDAKRQKDSLTDSELANLVQNNPAGVIYAWSPGMPFSYSSKAKRNGIVMIKTAVDELAAELHAPIKLDVAVDPTVKDELVKGVLARENVTMDATMGRSVQALDLLFRNINQHYPATLVYAHGKIARHVYPGVETVAKYKEVIKRTIEQLRDRGALR